MAIGIQQGKHRAKQELLELKLMNILGLHTATSVFFTMHPVIVLFVLACKVPIRGTSIPGLPGTNWYHLLAVFWYVYADVHVF